MRSITQYCENVSGGTLPVSGSETVDREKMFNEAIFLGLRTGELNVSMLRQVYGVDLFSTRSETLTEFSNEGLIQINDRSITLTRRGFLVCDAIAESLL